jgi:hypothetical protein
VLISVTRYSLFDPVITAAIAVWFIVSTGREGFASSEGLTSFNNAAPEFAGLSRYERGNFGLECCLGATPP